MTNAFNLWKQYHTTIGFICMFVLGGLVGIHLVNQATFDMFAPMIAAWTGYGVLRAVKNQPTLKTPTATKATKTS